MPVRLLRDELRDLYTRYLRELGAPVAVDVGTGFGENLRALVEASSRGAYVVTLDLDLLALQKAKTLFIQAYERGVMDLACADAHHPPLRRGSVKLITTVATLHHLADLRVFLKNCREVLADNGVFIAVDWTPGSRLTPHPPEEHKKVLDSFKQLFPWFFRLDDLRVYKDYFLVVGSKP
ncbi:class I SAM-dependent methyltransferase [Infirmifilum lucidum]|uniref:Class I SAM-dependent methyltransferase n=1 Tax=Infirmifilum lucidum TaxID=2776706 RepID=A0A7L9FHF4_9CREN|nr:class I SAM-dependent methyltransferase [Infirmifilum lucidum]QOJ79081.1 class I SAM-dependent methyltransferase [Infirmifilum lucidum]